MIKRQILLVAVVLGLCAAAFGQTKNFTPVDGATLKAKFESAIANGKANTTNGRFWVGYQFEVRPGVAPSAASLVTTIATLRLRTSFASLKVKKISNCARVRLTISAKSRDKRVSER